MNKIKLKNWIKYTIGLVVLIPLTFVWTILLIIAGFIDCMTIFCLFVIAGKCELTCFPSIWILEDIQFFWKPIK